jgi:major type 1 subunit fimbrin (pilin)
VQLANAAKAFAPDNLCLYSIEEIEDRYLTEKLREVLMYKKLVLSASAAVFAVFTGNSAYASDGTILFNGAVTAATCTVAVNGGTANGTVTLPTVSSTKLGASGQTAGATAFVINLTACTTGKTVNAFFEAGTTVDPLTGNLINGGTPLSNVEVQLLTAAAAPIAIGTTTQAKDTNINTTTTPAANLNYVAQYFATGASVAGPVTSSVTYSITYN